VKIVLFVEGKTETYLPSFFQRWLAPPRVPTRVGITAVNLRGVSNYRRDIRKRALVALAEPGVIGAVGLIDFYASGLEYPDGSVRHKYDWARGMIQTEVNHPRFRQHFAVHETEAWLLSQPDNFPREIVEHLPKGSPESINHRNTPSHIIARLYQAKLGKEYKKPTEGSKLFYKLDPDRASERCPHLKLLFDDMLDLAQAGIVK
jgi:hypothetical protein